MFQEGFQFYKPCRLLQPYIRYYWVFRSSWLLKTLTFPIGCPQLIFHKGMPLYIPELGTRQSILTVSGQVNYPAHLYSEGETEMIVVVFQPYGMRAFLHLPISALHNLEVSGFDLEYKRLEELAAQVFECKDTDTCINLIEAWLLSLLSEVQTPKLALNQKRIAAAINYLFSTPGTSVTTLASIACLSKKQFERLFNDMVGTNPKEYARIARFQMSLKLLQECPAGISQAQLAYQCGYADQSHFIREFKQFSGHTPVALLNICQPYSDLFTNPA